MNSSRARKIRRAVAQTMRTDLGAAWRCMQCCPWRARLRLACRLALGREMDGTRKDADNGNV